MSETTKQPATGVPHFITPDGDAPEQILLVDAEGNVTHRVSAQGMLDLLRERDQLFRDRAEQSERLAKLMRQVRDARDALAQEVG